MMLLYIELSKSFRIDQISSFATLLSGTEGPARKRHDSNIALTLLIRLLGVDDT